MKIATFIIIFLTSTLTFAQVEKESDTLEVWTLFSLGSFVNKNAE